MDERVESLGEAFPKMPAQVREILQGYYEIGPNGAFGAAMIEDLLQRADRAVISGDLVAMISIYEEMKTVQ